MACCANHDRLDKVLHTEEFISMTCGDLKHDTVQTQNAVGGIVHSRQTTSTTAADGSVTVHEVTKKAYCCPDCPTLIAAHKAA